MPKLSVSVPDDLWQRVHDPAASGPSETVQAGLAALAEQQVQERRPLAHAPDQGNLAQYREPFEAAVVKVAAAIKQVRNRGYQLGLALASGLTLADFGVLDQPTANTEIKELARNWGHMPDDDDRLLFSSEFWWAAAGWFESAGEGSALLGDDDEGVTGVTWSDSDDEGRLVPEFHDDLVVGLLDALRDVRDEALRRMETQHAEPGQ